jgi:putative ABC transport system ATP-binding protein
VTTTPDRPTRRPQPSPVAQLAGGAGTYGGGLSLRGVTKTYGKDDAQVHALRGIDLDIEPQELVVVLGPSGSGKTTLVNVIGGIEPVTSGQVTAAGRQISGLGPGDLSAFRRDHVGFVFQFFNLIPTLTARENVEIIVELTGRGDKKRIPELLEAVGLADRMDHFPAQLSGGQQQRVALARALATDPGLLLADEPTGSLDLATGRQILQLVQRLNRDGRTVVMVTHNASAAQIADRVVTVVDGQIQSVRHNPNPADAAAVAW